MVGLSLSGVTGAFLDGRYQLISLLGAGGMGQIYEGTHLSLDRKVAIKVLPSHLSVDHRFRARFAREARAVAKIAHRNVVQIIDFGESPEGPVYFVMEFLEGRDLGALLRETGRLPWPRARRLLLQAVSALKAAHAHGIIHRDIKPGNCFLVDLPHEGLVDVVKLLDFGIAKVSSELEAEGGTLIKPLTGTGEVMGTASYMAPEQARCEQLDARSDVYSLGIMAYEILTGRVPFVGVNPFHVVTRHLYDRPEPLRRLVPGILPDVEAFVLRAIAKEPEERFQSMAELEAAILAVEEVSIDSLPTLVRPAGNLAQWVENRRNLSTVVHHNPPDLTHPDVSEDSFENAQTPDPLVLTPRFRTSHAMSAEAEHKGREISRSTENDPRADPSAQTQPTRIRPITNPGNRGPSMPADEEIVENVGSTVSLLARAAEPSLLPNAIDVAVTAPAPLQTEGGKPRLSAFLGLGVLLASAAGIAAVTLLNEPEPRAAVDMPVVKSEREQPEAPVVVPAVTAAKPNAVHVEAPRALAPATAPVAPPRRERLDDPSSATESDHETKLDRALEAVEDRASEPEPADAEPETPTVTPVARSSKPKRYDTEDCKYHRERAHRSSNAGDYEEVIKLAAPGPCWSPSQRLERLRLYQDALSNTKRFADCVIVGSGSNDPTIARATEHCQSKL